MIVALFLTTALAQTPTNESRSRVVAPPTQDSVAPAPTVPSSYTPAKLKHYSETLYVDELKGMATAARFRLEKRVDSISALPVIGFVGVLIDRNLLVNGDKKVSGNASSPHFGIKAELYPDVWTWAEYRQKTWDSTDTAPSRSAADPRIGIAYEKEFAPIYSNWLIPECLLEFVQIQRLSMGWYDDGFGRMSARYLFNELTYVDLYGEYNFVSFPTSAIDTRNQLRAGIRAGIRLKKFSASMLLYQPYLETAPSRFEARGPEVMTYLSASL